MNALTGYLLKAGDPPVTAMKRVGRRAEVAELVCLLASDRASYVAGAIVPVDGGTMAPRALTNGPRARQRRRALGR